MLAVRKDEGLDFTFLGCKVRVNIEVQDGENILVLTQSAPPTDEESKMTTHALDVLKDGHFI